MKKAIVVLAVAAMVSGVHADMYADLAVGYGIFNNDGVAGGVGLVVDEVGQAITMQVVSGQSGIVTGSTTAGFDYDVDLHMLGALLAEGAFPVTAVGNWEDFAYGAKVTLAWQAYDADAWIVVTGTGTDQAYVANVGSMITDRAFDDKALPEGINFDNNAAGVGANAMVIPEPATFGLMGIAGLGMFLARKKARR